MRGGDAAAWQRLVVAGEPVRVVAAQPQGTGSHEQLGRVQTGCRVSRPLLWRSHRAARAAARSMIAVHSAASISCRRAKSTGLRLSGSTSARPGQLAALVDVGHAGHRQLHELGAERVRVCVRADRGHERRRSCRRARRLSVLAAAKPMAAAS